MPAWSAADEKVGQCKVTCPDGTIAGSVLELPGAKETEAPNRSLPVKRRSISAPAALKVLWPELYEGKGGVGNVVDWYGNHCPPSIMRVPWPGPPQASTCCPWKRKRSAVIGRTDANALLLSQQQMLPSKIALVSAKNNLTSESVPCSPAP